MSFTAEVKNIYIYPKLDHYLCFVILKQNDKIVKIVYRCTADDVIILTTHKGSIRFHANNPQVTTYKQQKIMMYEAKSIAAVFTENAIQTTNQKPLDIEFD